MGTPKSACCSAGAQLGSVQPSLEFKIVMLGMMWSKSSTRWFDISLKWGKYDLERSQLDTERYENKKKRARAASNRYFYPKAQHT